jgi:hypothetical protein
MSDMDTPEVKEPASTSSDGVRITLHSQTIKIEIQVPEMIKLWTKWLGDDIYLSEEQLQAAEAKGTTRNAVYDLQKRILASYIHRALSLTDSKFGAWISLATREFVLRVHAHIRHTHEYDFGIPRVAVEYAKRIQRSCDEERNRILALPAPISPKGSGPWTGGILRVLAARYDQQLVRWNNAAAFFKKVEDSQHWRTHIGVEFPDLPDDLIERFAYPDVDKVYAAADNPLLDDESRARVIKRCEKAWQPSELAVEHAARLCGIEPDRFTPRWLFGKVAEGKRLPPLDFDRSHWEYNRERSATDDATEPSAQPSSSAGGAAGNEHEPER